MEKYYWCVINCYDWADQHRLSRHMILDLEVEGLEMVYTETSMCNRGYNSDSGRMGCFESLTKHNWLIRAWLTQQQFNALQAEYESFVEVHEYDEVDVPKGERPPE